MRHTHLINEILDFEINCNLPTFLNINKGDSKLDNHLICSELIKLLIPIYSQIRFY